MRIIVMMLIFAIFLISSADVFAQCRQHEQMVAELKREYNETVSSLGLNSKGVVIEILVSPTGTFTIILTRPTGLSCVIAEGNSWEKVDPPLDNPV